MALAVALAVGGCQAIGAGGVPRDRVGYAGAIGDSWKDLTLLNIVKLRYLDTPVYLDVSSVVSSYSLATDVSISASIFPRASDSNSLGLGASGSFSESPTISYTPLTGTRLFNSLLRPIPPETVFTMIGAGHPADFILRATVRAINGIYNVTTTPSRAQREDPKFTQLIEAIRRIEQAGAFGIRSEKHDDRTSTFVTLRRGVSEDADRDIRLVKETLGIDPKFDELRVISGLARRRPDELGLLTRSMQGLMGELATGVDVPEQDLRDGRATPRPGAVGNTADTRLVHIRSSREQPPDAYAAVHYRGYWFWIDDRDLVSKRMFMFLMTFSSLAESGALPQAPVLTIPTR
jgi:hypothetical protein